MLEDFVDLPKIISAQIISKPCFAVLVIVFLLWKGRVYINFSSDVERSPSRSTQKLAPFYFMRFTPRKMYLGL